MLGTMGIDWLTLKGKHAESAFVHTTKRFLTNEALKRLNPKATKFDGRLCQATPLSRHRDLKLLPYEDFDSFSPRQSQAKDSAFAFDVNVKVKEGAALALGSHPIGQFIERDAR